AEACARHWAGPDSRFFLVARNSVHLGQIADDLAARGASAESYVLDANIIEGHAAMLDAAQKMLGAIDIVLIAHGTLSDQQACQNSVAQTLAEINTNGLSTVALLTLIANIMEQQGRGSIVVISSVAGDRGRPSNYVYGAAKAMVSAFCDGMRARLFKAGVHLVTVKPGFVDTPMTAGLNLPKLLTASTVQVARDIDNAVARKKEVLYTAWYWRWIMLIIKTIPASIFKKLSL
ncbi:MAG TPA: SDR family oxidoreductase, partial [Spongiibacteraceae bacterium]|nr:SDR family oxidoreductase [Spongiibacteraceae bacterium]